MSDPSRSYLKVNYEFRPAKQVERRMLIDAFQMLGEGGFPIREYRYVGMGSVYFIDFILFHRLLGIDRMMSVEYDTLIEKRINFNRPFDFVDIRISPVADVIPNLSPDQKHILWLDYDDIISRNQLQDIALASTYLAGGSILLVTIDVEPPTDTDRPKDWKEYFVGEGGDYIDKKVPLGAFAKSELPKRNIELVDKALKAGLVGRSDVGFIPIFNFLYKDSHQMITVGGMFGGKGEKRKIRGSALADAFYYRPSLRREPCVIQVPLLTRKERQYLERLMPYDDSYSPRDFEITTDLLHAYREIYRFCPSYAELLL